ncbi:hypothetical protein AAG570_007070, partial [Ranatra chinensis]
SPDTSVFYLLDGVLTHRFLCVFQIQLDFKKFTLAVPNDCESNFVDVFAERTDLPSRLNNFCGSIAEMVMSPGNTLQIRFLAQPQALGSNFEALYTAFRDKPKGESCGEGEYDCEDGNCISAELKCNGRINCRFRWDEDVNECTVSTVFKHILLLIIINMWPKKRVRIIPDPSQTCIYVGKDVSASYLRTV